MPKDKSEEFGEIFEPKLKSKLRRCGFKHYEIECDSDLFDDEFDEDSQNEDLDENQAQRLRYNCKAKFRCFKCHNKWTSYYAQMAILIRVEDDYYNSVVKYSAKVYNQRCVSCNKPGQIKLYASETERIALSATKLVAMQIVDGD